MKAIFMTEIGGRLVEIERRDIPKMMVFYKAIIEPLKARVIHHDEEITMQPLKKEVWSLKSKPVTENDFAIFTLDRIE